LRAAGGAGEWRLLVAGRGGEGGDEVAEVGLFVGAAAGEGAWGGPGEFGVAEVGAVGQ
jgi:hypothetical protein